MQSCDFGDGCWRGTGERGDGGSQVLRIDLDPAEGDRWEGADFAVFSRMEEREYQAGDVRTYCSGEFCNSPEATLELPTWLESKIQSTLQPGVRALIGNAGCELTFRQIHCENAEENVKAMLRWAEWAYGLVGKRLVLGPMDFDLIHDVMTGARLLGWAAAHGVPLAVFCGYRFLFSEDAFPEIERVSASYSFALFGNPYRYPFAEVSDAIRESGAEAWTGAGFADGLRWGVFERAREFGFSGVLTTKEAWLDGT